MTGSNVFGWFFLGTVMAIIVAEVYAALGAVGYASKAEGSVWRKLSVAVTRWEWASPMFHEMACTNLGLRPSYRTSYSLGIWLGIFTVLAGAMALHLMSADLGVLLGGSASVAVGHFAVAYGAAFVEHREYVLKEIQAGTWNLA